MTTCPTFNTRHVTNIIFGVNNGEGDGFSIKENVGQRRKPIIRPATRMGNVHIVVYGQIKTSFNGFLK